MPLSPYHRRLDAHSTHQHHLLHRYEALLDEARRGLIPPAAGARFREEDLRALLDAIHRREARLEKLKRHLLRRRGPALREEAQRDAGRLSLLNEIRGVSGLSLFEEVQRR